MWSAYWVTQDMTKEYSGVDSACGPSMLCFGGCRLNITNLAPFISARLGTLHDGLRHKTEAAELLEGHSLPLSVCSTWSHREWVGKYNQHGAHAA